MGEERLAQHVKRMAGRGARGWEKAQSRGWKNWGNSSLRSPSLREAGGSQGARCGWVERPTRGSHRPDMSSLEAQLQAQVGQGRLILFANRPLSLGLALGSCCCPQLIAALSGVCLFLHRELSISALETRAQVGDGSGGSCGLCRRGMMDRPLEARAVPFPACAHPNWEHKYLNYRVPG